MSKNVKSNIETGLRLVPVSTSNSTSLGDLEVNSISSKIFFHNGSINSALVTEDSAHDFSGFVRQVGNTRATPQAVGTADTITIASNQRAVVYIESDGGAVTLTSLQQITVGALTEQELIVIGTSNTDTLTIVNGNGLILNGDCTLGDYDQIYLRYDGVDWVEISRNF